MNAPLLGLFGNDDKSPSPARCRRSKAELDRLGKDYEFHSYDGAVMASWTGQELLSASRPRMMPGAGS